MNTNFLKNTYRKQLTEEKLFAKTSFEKIFYTPSLRKARPL
jgi:hypothetical protein